MNINLFLPYFAIGDIVSVRKGLFTHVGVIVAGGVLQNSPGGHERIVSLSEFSQGKKVNVRRTFSDPMLIEKRARAVLAAPRKYDALNQNCEHTVHEVVYGEKYSPQLGFIVLGLIVSLGAIVTAGR
jgi:hypothetical protein